MSVGQLADLVADVKGGVLDVMLDSAPAWRSRGGEPGYPRRAAPTGDDARTARSASTAKTSVTAVHSTR